MSLLTKYEWEARERYRLRLAWHHVMMVWGAILLYCPAAILFCHYVLSMSLRTGGEPYLWAVALVGLIALVKSIRFLWYDFRQGP